MNSNVIEVFTDGSCHTQLKIGGWASILFFEGRKEVIYGSENGTTHNRMEILAVLKALEHLTSKNKVLEKVIIHSDSQYVVNIITRKEKLKRNKFLSKKGTPLQNADLVQRLIHFIENHNIEFVKVKAHQKETDIINHNHEVDKIVRKLVREKVKL